MTNNHEMNAGEMPEEIFVEYDIHRNSAGFYSAKKESKWGGEVKYIRADLVEKMKDPINEL